MATLLSDKAVAGVQPKASINRDITVVSVFTLSAALALNDIIRGTEMPNGATVTDVVLSTTDLDTNGTPLISVSVGDTGDPDRFILSNIVGRAGGVASLDNLVGHGHKYTTSGNFVDLTVVAGPATGAVTGTVRMAVSYTMDP